MRCYDSCSTASYKAGDSNTNTRKTGGRDVLGDQPVSAEKEVGGKMGKSVARGEWGGCHKRRAQGCKDVSWHHFSALYVKVSWILWAVI